MLASACAALAQLCRKLRPDQATCAASPEQAHLSECPAPLRGATRFVPHMLSPKFAKCQDANTSPNPKLISTKQTAILGRPRTASQGNQSKTRQLGHLFPVLLRHPLTDHHQRRLVRPLGLSLRQRCQRRRRQWRRGYGGHRGQARRLPSGGIEGLKRGLPTSPKNRRIYVEFAHVTCG